MSFSDNETYMAPIYFNFLKDKLDVSPFNHNDLFLEKLQRSRLNRIYNRLFPRHFVREINQILLSKVEHYKPDVLLLFKGQEILPQTLEEIKKQGVFLINYNLDHPFTFQTRGSGNKFVTESFEIYDAHITYSHKIKDEVLTRYPNTKIEVLPFGYHDQYTNPVEHEIKKICFVGGPDENRINIINELVNQNLPVAVYGPKWHSILTLREHLEVREQVEGEAYYETLSSYRVQLNIFREHNEDSHNMRSMEVPGAGGIMLAPRSREHSMFFEEDKEVFFYNNIEDLISKARFILALDDTSAQDIRKNAIFRCVSSGYAYKDRAIQLLDVLNLYVNGVSQR